MKFKVSDIVKWKGASFTTVGGVRVDILDRLMQIKKCTRLVDGHQNYGDNHLYECCYLDDLSPVLNGNNKPIQYRSYDLGLADITEIAKFRIKNGKS